MHPLQLSTGTHDVGSSRVALFAQTQSVDLSWQQRGWCLNASEPRRVQLLLMQQIPLSENDIMELCCTGINGLDTEMREADADVGGGDIGSRAAEEGKGPSSGGNSARVQLSEYYTKCLSKLIEAFR